MKTPDLTYQDVEDVLDREILIAAVSGGKPTERKKLTYNPSVRIYTLVIWNGETFFYSFADINKAIEDYNRS